MNIEDILEYLEREYEECKAEEEHWKQSPFPLEKRFGVVMEGAKFQTYQIWKYIYDMTSKGEYEQ